MVKVNLPLEKVIFMKVGNNLISFFCCHFSYFWCLGEFKNGEACGQGTYTSSNGDILSGNWSRNMLSGKGRIVYQNGSCYEG